MDPTGADATDSQDAQPQASRAKPPPLIDELPLPKTAARQPAQARSPRSSAESLDHNAQRSPEVQSLLRKAHALRSSGDLTGAAQTVIEAAELAPGDAAVVTMLGDIQRQAGRSKAALKSYERAKSIEQPDSSRAVIESKIAHVALESVGVGAAGRSAALDVSSGGIIIAASAIAPGLGQAVAGKIARGALQFAVWLLSTILFATVPGTSALLTAMMHLPSTGPGYTSGADGRVAFFFIVSVAAWLYSVIDAVWIVRSTKKG